ncbi:transcriptional regulator [Mesorhizobium japonicum MAFF 303099]|uniref:Transcriptional regulator n=2 Tax=Mesorhizobium japonicum TaxID=2066070 RepID=Q989Y4_RHILO|nr:GlxA family transcriptional regulator [Mesorhizobium japonicum]BAB52560.1 transcriptional regulator [Mesorhizobium japonicum MAFF 303099]
MKVAKRLFSLYLWPGFSLQAFSSAVEALRLANEVLETESYAWRVVSDDGHPVRSNSGLTISVDTSLKEERGLRGRMGSFPSVAVICGGSHPLAVNRALNSWLRDCRARKLCLVGIASGVFSIAQTGLADGRRCAVHWEQFPSFVEQFPGVTAVQSAFEIDGDTYSCSGGDAAFDMFVQFVIEDYDTSIASRVCEKAAAMRVRQPGDRQRLPRHAGAAIHHEGLLKIIEQMERNLDEPVALEDMAASNCLSRRQVERIFSKQIGRSPARYYLEMRLERAHLLIVNSQLPVVEIAMACGFISASHFSKAYRENYGMTPREARSEAVERRRNGPAARPTGNVAQGGLAACHVRKHAQNA